MIEGKKFDGGKLRLDLIPPEVLEALGQVLTYGADKYGDRNWEGGMDYGRIYAALQRHLLAWLRGEQSDPESHIHHLHHALANIAFLATYDGRGLGYRFDNLTKQRRGSDADTRGPGDVVNPILKEVKE